MTNVPNPPAQAKNPLAIPVAVAGAVLFLVAAAMLFSIAQKEGIDEKVWNRLMVVFNSVASVGFACFGVLLGTTVQNAKLIEVKADAAKKTDAMNNAIDTLAKKDQPGSANLTDGRTTGAAVPDDRAETASRILRRGLS